jgi:hypothetical protein
MHLPLAVQDVERVVDTLDEIEITTAGRWHLRRLRPPNH